MTLIVALLLSNPQTANADYKFTFYDAHGDKWKTTINENAKMHDYDWSKLSNKKKVITYKDERYKIQKGIDVSYYNGKIKWKKVKKAGYDFAIIRLGYRGYGNGSLNIDKQFYRNIKYAKKAGLDVGVYFFAQAINVKEAKQEANFVLKALKGKKLDLPIVYDPELIKYAKARTDKISGKQFTKNTLAFCKKIENAGYDAMIYSNMYWEAYLFDMKKIEKYPVWYADYKKKPQTPYNFTYWQYTSKGKVNGIKGRVDLNVRFVPVEKE